MRYGYWLPVFGGWLRNVPDENMAASWEYSKKLAIRAEQIGFDLTLVAELNLNDIKGEAAPSLDAWSTAAALAAVTHTQEIMVAVRPTFHSPALLAKQAAQIDHISGGRLSLNVVSSWWADEAKRYGVLFEQHDNRYARTQEWLHIVDNVWKTDGFSFAGDYYKIDENVLQPKPLTKPRPPDLCRRGIRNRQRFNRPNLRRLRYARRQPGKNRSAYRRYANAPRKVGTTAPAFRSCRVFHCTKHRRRRASGTRPHYKRSTVSGGVSKLSAMVIRHKIRGSRFFRRLFRI